MNGIEEFEIVIINNHKCIFHPGQIIQGYVILETSEPMMTKGIEIQIFGCLSVHWTELSPGTGNRCVDTKEFSASEEYFCFHQVLFDPGILYPAEHKFDFQYRLPKALPESYEDDLCLTDYVLEARIKHDDPSPAAAVRKNFFIMSPFDLNDVVIPDVKSPVSQHATQTLCFWCCRSLPINATLWLRRSGFTPGESIKVYAEIENNTSRIILKSYVRLMRQRKYITRKKTRKEVEELARVDGGRVEPYNKYEYSSVPLVIPRDPCQNMDVSRIFDIQYYLEMVVEPKGAKSIVLPPLQIVMGTISLRKKKPKKLPPLGTVKKAKKQEKSARERRKVREHRVTPSDETDTTDFVRNPNRMTFDWTVDNSKLR